MSNTFREDMRAIAIEQAVPHVCQFPEMAGEIAKGINTLIDDVLGAEPKEASPGNDHATKVLYPSIKAAMDELEKLPPWLNLSVNKAFNILRGAFWSETPAPAGASPKRAERFCTCGPNMGCDSEEPCVRQTVTTGTANVAAPTNKIGPIYAAIQGIKEKNNFRLAEAARAAAVVRMHTNPSPADYTEYAEIIAAIARGEKVEWLTRDGEWVYQHPSHTLGEIKDKAYPPTRYRVAEVKGNWSDFAPGLSD